MSFRLLARSSSAISTFFSRRHALLTVAFTIAVATVCPGAQAQSTAPPVTYTITDLGVLPGGDQLGYQGSAGAAINASGDVAGFSSDSAGVPHPVLFRGGKVIDLGFVSPPLGGMAYGVNGYDQVTGELEFVTSGTSQVVFNHAFLYSAGKLNDIGTAPGYDSSYGTAINDSGQITGLSSFYGSAPANVFSYRAGEFTNITNFRAPIAGNNINASGQIAGQAGGGAAIFSNGSFELLNFPTFPPSIPSEASAINDSGDATGDLYYLEDDTHAFLSSNGNGVDIGALPGDRISYGTSINAASQIVGISNNSSENRPFLYTPGQGMVSLQSLLPANSKWQLTDATAINDKGQITGSGYNPQGYRHAYLLSPVFTSFANLDVAAGIIGTPGTAFAAGAQITLGKSSDGINPLTETVVLELDGYHIAIPPGSFVQVSPGVYVYEGKIGNTVVDAAIRRIEGTTFLIGIIGQQVTALPTTYPFNMVLTIGNDTGTGKIESNYDLSQVTKAELCNAFAVPCN